MLDAGLSPIDKRDHGLSYTSSHMGHYVHYIFLRQNVTKDIKVSNIFFVVNIIKNLHCRKDGREYPARE